MNHENTKDTQNESVQTESPDNTHAEQALTDAHNADMGTPEPTSVEEIPLTEEEKWKKEAGDWKDKYMRLYADFDNSRKRGMKERAELFTSASADIIKEMLPILDDFDRAVKANETVEDLAVVKEGFVLIHQKFYKKLESKGLMPVIAIGKPFDTDFHEAITQIPAPTSDMVGKVVDELEKGYCLNDKVIRFSKVVIGQ
jgi:molecular chaperone GrpE